MKIPGPAKPAQGQAPVATLSLTGIASGAIFGNQSAAAVIQDTGVASSARIGDESIAAVMADVGIASGARIGDEFVTPAISATGIASGVKIGDIAIAATIGDLGISAGAKIGNESAAAVISDTGVASGVRVGNIQITTGLTLALTGIPSGAVVGNEAISLNLGPAGIPSRAAFGSETTSLTVQATGVASGSSLGLPTLAEVLHGIGIPTGQLFGNTTISLAGVPVALYLPGIPSAAKIGLPSIAPIAIPVPPPLADAIYQYVVAVLESAFDVPTVIWEFEGGPRPNVFPYLSLNIVRSHGVGQAYQSSIAADVGAQGVFQPKDWTVRINGWGGGSRDLVEAIRQSLEAPWWIDTLESLGLSYRDMSQPRAQNRIIDFQPENGWGIDISFGVTAELAQSIAAWIEFAIISGTIVAPDGSKQVLPGQTVGK